MARDVVTRDEQWALIRNGHGHAEYLIVAGWGPDTWIQEANGRPGFASFDVYEIVGTDIRQKNRDDEEWTFIGHFGFTKADTRGETTTDLDEAVRVAFGSVKWDGCCNYRVAEDEDLGYACMLHACDVEDLVLLGEALQLAYRLCAAIVEVEPQTPAVDEPDRPELEQPGTVTAGRDRPVEDWVLEVYNPAVATFTEYLSGFGVPPEVADHNARSLLARLALLQPPLTIEKLT